MKSRMHAMGETGASTVPAFLTKLWTLVDDSSTDELICWDVSGKSFHVFDQGRFSKEVLPLYFKHSNIASFIRQLNMYGFRKVVGVESGGLKTEKDDMEFAHQYFIHDQENLLEFIKRKVPQVKADEMKIKHDDVNRVLNDVRALKGKQDHMSSKLENVKRENELLWREVAALRQKHHKQQQIVNKLIQFLMSLVQNRGLDRKRKMPLMISDTSQLEKPNKVPKFSKQLSIESEQSVPPYQVSSVSSPEQWPINQPAETELEADPVVRHTLSIHDVTDQSSRGQSMVSPTDLLTTADYMTSNPPTLPTPMEAPPSTDSRAVINPQDILDALARNASSSTLPTESFILEPLNPEEEDPPAIFDVSELLQPVASQLANLTSQGAAEVSKVGVSDKVLSTASVAPIMDTSVVPSTIVKNPKKLHREMSDHLDSLQTDLESLKDLLSSGHYNIEPHSFLGLYDMFGYLNPAELPSTSAGDLSGTEVVAYNPLDISTLFDLGDLTPVTPFLKDDTDMALLTNDDSVLNTPIGTELSSPFGPKTFPSTTTSTEDLD